jgi:hypothetical protein
MTKYWVETTYSAGAQGTVTFPDGKTWEDVESWFIKRDYLHVLFKGENDYRELCLNSDNSPEMTDWKRPNTVTVLASDELGDPDYDTVVAESE